MNYKNGSFLLLKSKVYVVREVLKPALNELVNSQSQIAT